MMMKFWFSFIVLFCLVVAPAYGQTAHTEVDVTKEIAEQFTTLFNQGRFDELNKLAETYRTDHAMTPAGAWKLTYLYNGIASLPYPKDEHEWDLRDKAFAKWVAEKPSPMAYIAYAKINQNRGWSYRGNGYANTVTQEKWRQFFTYLHKADTILTDHKDSAAVDPEWYRTMITLAKDEEWKPDDSKPLFAEAMQKHKYYHKIYEEIFVSIQPKWGGSYEQMRRFADVATDYTRDKDGSSLYALLYRYVINCGCKDESVAFEMVQPDMTKLKAGIADVLKEYPDDWNYNSFAHMACMAGDKDYMRFLTQQIKMPIINAWGDESEYNRCKVWEAKP